MKMPYQYLFSSVCRVIVGMVELMTGGGFSIPEVDEVELYYDQQLVIYRLEEFP